MKEHVMDSVENLMVNSPVIVTTRATNTETVVMIKLNFVAVNLHQDTILPLHHTLITTLLNQDRDHT